MTWSTPPFRDLPESTDPLLRWVGSTIMDEEQYRIERWESRQEATATYWRASSAGMEEYFALREQRKAERKAAWRAREENESAYTDWVNGELDARGMP